MTRPDTPDEITSTGMRMTVKRNCDRCGRMLGDATEQEATLGQSGEPLPSVLAECGCWFADAVIAALEGHRHVEMIPFPLPHWECECGQDLGAYLGDPNAALAPHQVLIARDAVHAALNTLNTLENS